MNQEIARTPIGIGHNSQSMRDMLLASYTDLQGDVARVIASSQRAPVAITDDETNGKFGDLVKIVIGVAKKAEEARKVEKEPFLRAGQEVDAFFNVIRDDLGTHKNALLSRQTTYLTEKERKERERQTEIARIAAEEAARKLDEATSARAPEDAATALNEAVDAETRSAEAALAANAKPADLVRTHGAMGSTSSLKAVWVYEITDRGKIPLDILRPYLPADAIDKAIAAYVKAGYRELHGVRIYETRKAVVR